MLTQRQLFLNHNAQTSPNPLLLEIEKATGIYLYQKDGFRLMDLISGIGVSNIGHCHPNVVQAVQEQTNKYMHLMVYGEYVQSPQVQFAKALADSLPSSLNCTYFVNSGAEAVEGAMKLAKRFTNRREIIACKNSYHGSTHGALSLMGAEEFKQAYRPLLPGINFINFNRIDDLSKITENTAAVFIETVQGEAGIRLAEKTYMQALAARCKEVGCLLVLDEIQCGFGRTGKMYAFEHYDIVPDILLLAKGIGGGMPIGAFIASREIMQVFTHNPILGHISTFAGHPVNCAAGLATIKTILGDNLVADVSKKGELFKSLLVHPAIKQVRGLGLMLAVEFESFEFNKAVIDACIEDGIISDWFLHCSNSMRLAPPLIITEDEIRLACAIILKNIETISQR